MSMTVLKDKQQVSLCRPFSAATKRRTSNFFCLVSAYENTFNDFSLSDFQSPNWQRVMDDLIYQSGFQNDPTIQYGLAKRLHDSRLPDKAFPYLKQAIKHFQHDKKPEMMLTDIMSLMLAHDMINYAVALGEKAIKHFPNNPVMHNTLGIAAVEARMRKIFDYIKPELNMPKSQIDYLDAKLSFLDNDSARTREILEPYVFKTETCKNSMLGLYLACIGDGTGLHALLPLFKGQVTYNFLLKRRDEWQSNSLRVELGESDTYSSSWRIHEEGVNAAASRGNRLSAGFYAPIGIKPT
jgi:hypothetical protein